MASAPPPHPLKPPDLAAPPLLMNLTQLDSCQESETRAAAAAAAAATANPLQVTGRKSDPLPSFTRVLPLIAATLSLRMGGEEIKLSMSDPPLRHRALDGA